MNMFFTALNIWINREQYDEICKTLNAVPLKDKEGIQEIHFGGWPVYIYQDKDGSWRRIELEY